MDDELPELLEGRARRHVAGELRSGIRINQAEDRLRDVLGRTRHRGPNRLQEALQHRPLELAPEREQRRAPLPFLVDFLEAAVVEFVADEELELQLVVGERVKRQGNYRTPDGPYSPRQLLD